MSATPEERREAIAAAARALGVDVDGGEQWTVELYVATIGQLQAGVANAARGHARDLLDNQIGPVRALAIAIGVPGSLLERITAQMLRAIGGVYTAAADIADESAAQLEQIERET